MKMAISRLEIKRQIFHLLFGIIAVILLNYGLLSPSILLFVIFAGLAASFLSKRFRLPLISWLLDNFERKEDINTMPGKGALYYVLGCFLAIYFFQRNVASAAILILAFGDSISHLFGVHYGKIKHPFNDKKFLEGTLFGFLGSFAISLFFVSVPEAFFASLAAMLVEAMEVKIGANTINDNLVMPVVAGVVMSLVRVVF